MLYWSCTCVGCEKYGEVEGELGGRPGGGMGRELGRWILGDVWEDVEESWGEGRRVYPGSFECGRRARRSREGMKWGWGAGY